MKESKWFCGGGLRMTKPGALPAIELSGWLPPTYSQGPDPWGVWDS